MLAARRPAALRLLAAVAALAALPLAGGGTASGAGPYAVKFLAAKLTVPAQHIALNVGGPTNFGTFSNDATASLAPGAYTVTLRGGDGTYGTFVLSDGGQLSGFTGALKLGPNANEVDFDLGALAAVALPCAKLTVGHARSGERARPRPPGERRPRLRPVPPQRPRRDAPRRRAGRRR